MTHFKITYKDGKIAHQDAASKEKLIEQLFKGDPARFQSEVRQLEWREKTLYCVEHVQTGEIERRVVGADTNPYGWRKENPEV